MIIFTDTHKFCVCVDDFKNRNIISYFFKIIFYMVKMKRGFFAVFMILKFLENVKK